MIFTQYFTQSYELLVTMLVLSGILLLVQIVCHFLPPYG